MNDDTTPNGRLDAVVPSHPLPLRKLPHYRIASGDPDVRGWEVLGSDGRKIGEVDDLLVDTQQLRARYLDVSLDFGLFKESGTGEGAEGADPGPEAFGSTLEAPVLPPEDVPAELEGLGAKMKETVVRATLSDEENRLTQEHHLGFNTRHVLIPIGRARLDAEHDRILVEGLRSADAPNLPDYTGQALDRDDEARLRRHFDDSYIHAPEQEFYAHHLYDQDRFYGSRRLNRDESLAESARAAGLEPGALPVGAERDEAPQEETVLPVRGSS